MCFPFDGRQGFAQGVEYGEQRGSYLIQRIPRGRVSGCVFVGCGSGKALLFPGISTQTRRVVGKVRVEHLRKV